MVSAMKATAARDAAVTGVAVAVVVAVASARAKVKAPIQARVNASMLKVAQRRQKRLPDRMRRASQGRIVALAMPHRASVRSVLNAQNVQSDQNVQSAVAVAVAAQTARTYRKVKFAAKFAMTHDLKAAVNNLRTTAKLANPGVKAGAAVAIVANHVGKVVVRVAQSAPSALPALMMADQVQVLHPQRWPKGWRMALQPMAILRVVTPPNWARAVARVLAIAMAVSAHRVVSAMTSALIVHCAMHSSRRTAWQPTIQHPMKPESPLSDLSVPAILQHPRWQPPLPLQP